MATSCSFLVEIVSMNWRTGAEHGVDRYSLPASILTELSIYAKVPFGGKFGAWICRRSHQTECFRLVTIP